jgi:hypothetical protein
MVSPCHTLHYAVAVIAGSAELDIANPTEVSVGSETKTVTAAQPVYSVVDQDSAKSGTGTP